MKTQPVFQKIIKILFIIFIYVFSVGLMAQGLPTATTQAATDITGYEATLNATINANNANTTVYFEFGLNTNYGTLKSANPNPITGSVNTPITALVNELTPNTTYHFRVVATNTSGTVYGDDISFTTSVPAPTVVTANASSISASGATLNGTVNARNDSTTVTFEYGLTTAYGSSVTAAESPITGTTAVSVSKAISGLTTGTTYHYRVGATNSGGTTYGTDKTFLTGTPPTATTTAATGVNASSATLNGTVNAHGTSTTVYFEVGLSTSYGITLTADQSPVTGSTNTAVSYSRSGFQANRTYHYRVVAENAIDTVYGSDMTFTTTAVAPTATTNAATDITSTSATLNGTVNANNASTTVTFQYGLTTAYGSTLTASQSPVTGAVNTAVSIGIAGLTDATTYHYRVVAQSANGTTYGSDHTFHTGGIAPTATTNAATLIGPTIATFNGTVNAQNNETIITFEYGLTTSYRDSVTASQSPISTGTDTPVSASITRLTQNTLYHYRVVASNSLGTTYGSDLTFTTLLPATASTNAASSISSTSATLNGTVNANATTATVTFQYGTTIGYGTTVTPSQSPVSGSSNTAVNYPLSSLTPNTTYHYRVVAQTFYGTIYGGDRSFTTNAIVPAATTQAATSITYRSATLNGIVNANNATSTVTFEYGLTTAYGATITATPSSVTGLTNTSVTGALTGLTPSSTYHYRIVAQNSAGTTYGLDSTFSTVPTSTATLTTSGIFTITGTSAQSGGTITDDGGETITARGVCWDTKANPTIAGNHTTNGTGTGTFSSHMTGLSENTIYYVRAYATNAQGTAYGQQIPFKTNVQSISVHITNPGQDAVVSGIINITATATATDSATQNNSAQRTISKITFSINTTIIGEDTTDPYQISWDSRTVEDGFYTITVQAYNILGETSVDVIGITVKNELSTIGLNRIALNFASNGIHTTSTQTLMITNLGGDTLHWTVSDNADWLTCSPVSGVNTGVVYVSVNPTGLVEGNYNATITIADTKSEIPSVTLNVLFSILNPGLTLPPYGYLEGYGKSPTVMSSIPVTGWVLDDIETMNVKIYRAPLAEEGTDLIYIGDAVFVDGARPDIEDIIYPTVPLCYRAGWGYMLLTYLLPGGGNGTFTLYAIATDKEGNEAILGSKTIICDNAHAKKPFGALDTPAQGGSASGASYINYGWALTPLDNIIPIDGSTIQVYIDGFRLPGHPVYNQYRSDIATLFPGYKNSNGAIGYYVINTHSLANGVHTISWSVTDSAGNIDGVGSRFFTVVNEGLPDTSTSADADIPVLLPGIPTVSSQEIRISELQRLVIPLDVSVQKGYLKMKTRFAALPIGSTLDSRKGVFYWSPGVGFIGEYTLVFVFKEKNNSYYQKEYQIIIKPLKNTEQLN